MGAQTSVLQLQTIYYSLFYTKQTTTFQNSDPDQGNRSGWYPDWSRSRTMPKYNVFLSLQTAGVNYITKFGENPPTTVW